MNARSTPTRWLPSRWEATDGIDSELEYIMKFRKVRQMQQRQLIVWNIAAQSRYPAQGPRAGHPIAGILPSVGPVNIAKMLFGLTSPRIKALRLTFG